jgi:nucleoid-associated protein YgaU
MSRKAFAASNAGTTVEDGMRVYTVRAGDSLAYISLQFFGVLNAYTRILEANRDTLQSPDKIQVGQRLIIPS